MSDAGDDEPPDHPDGETMDPPYEGGSDSPSDDEPSSKPISVEANEGEREDGGRPQQPSQDSGDGSVTVLGTAHVSQASVDEVYEEAARQDPDVIAVELDEGRYRQIRGDTPDDIEASDLLSGNTVFQFLAYWMLSYVQSRLGEQFDVEPGADMKAGIDAAKRQGAGLALADRDIQVTMQRFWARLSISEKMKMVGALALGVTDPRTVGLTFGVVVGLFFGAVTAAFVAPWFGFQETLQLGVTSQTTLGYFGAAGSGVFLGAVLGVLFLPSLDAGRTAANGGGDRTSAEGDRVAGSALTSGYASRIVGGIVLGVGLCLTLLVTETSIGPLSPAMFETAGGTAIRGSVGMTAGVGIGALVGGVVGLLLDGVTADVEDVDEIDIERLTDGDVVSAMMEEFRRFSPQGARALIDERDAYIAHNLHALRRDGYDVLAIVGAGHKAGIDGYLERPETLPPMSSITGTAKSRRFSPLKLFAYLVMVAFVGFFFLLLMAGVQDIWLLYVFLAWVLFNGAFAFTLARIAGARLSSAGVGGSVAWLTSINPLLAPGWFAGYVELRHRPVNVSDIGTLNEIVDDTEQTLGEMFERLLDVPLFRLIFIVAMTNVGSIIATLLFPVVVLPWLAADIGGVDVLMNELLSGAIQTLEQLAGVFR